jgi:hypothetical protein
MIANIGEFTIMHCGKGLLAFDVHNPITYYYRMKTQLFII